jgi:UDP-N-acetylmuramate--alanine ligase
MTIEKKQVLSKEAMLDWVSASKPGLLVMAGAGDIDAMVTLVKERLLKSNDA